jgi:hypothetical protein
VARRSSIPLRSVAGEVEEEKLRVSLWKGGVYGRILRTELHTNYRIQCKPVKVPKLCQMKETYNV